MPRRTIMDVLIATGKASKMFNNYTSIEYAQKAENALRNDLNGLSMNTQWARENKEYHNSKNYFSVVRNFKRKWIR